MFIVVLMLYECYMIIFMLYKRILDEYLFASCYLTLATCLKIVECTIISSVQVKIIVILSGNILI